MTAYNNDKEITLCRKCGIMYTEMFRCGQNYYRKQFEMLSFFFCRGIFSFHIGMASGNERAQVALQTHAIRVRYNQNFFSLCFLFLLALILTAANEKRI